MKHYPRLEDALADGMRLAEAMSLKFASVEFPHGGGKAVIALPTPEIPHGEARHHLLREYGCEHAGIVCLPTLVASDAVCRKQLKVLLAEYQLSSFWLSAVYPRTQRGAFKLKLFIESLTASFAGGDPPWDKALIERGVIPHALIEE